MNELMGSYRYRVALTNGDSVDFLADGVEIDDWHGGAAMRLFIRDRERDRQIDIAAWNTDEWKSVQMVTNSGGLRSF